MIRFRTELETSAPRHTSYRDAKTPEHAAAQVAHAWHAAAGILDSGYGHDAYGKYWRFVLTLGRRAAGTIRIWEGKA